MDSCAAPSNCGLRCGDHKNPSRASENPQIFSISRTIPLDMFAKLSTIRAQSGKKWRRVVELGRECRAVGPWKQSANPTASSGESKYQNQAVSYRNATAGANQRVIFKKHTPGGLFEGFYAAGQLSSDGGRERPA